MGTMRTIGPTHSGRLIDCRDPFLTQEVVITDRVYSNKVYREKVVWTPWQGRLNRNKETRQVENMQGPKNTQKYHLVRITC